MPSISYFKIIAHASLSPTASPLSQLIQQTEVRVLSPSFQPSWKGTSLYIWGAPVVAGTVKDGSLFFAKMSTI